MKTTSLAIGLVMLAAAFATSTPASAASTADAVVDVQVGTAGCSVLYLNLGLVVVCSNVGSPGCTTVTAGAEVVSWCGPPAGYGACNVAYLNLGAVELCSNLGQPGCTTLIVAGIYSFSWCD